MRIIPLLITALLTIFEIIVLDTKWLLPLPLGSFLSPQQGIWPNAEPVDANFNADLSMPGLTGTGTVFFDERLVPHVFADKEEDAYFIQGYLHAKFRLWQMEFQTHAAAGRVSEIIGPVAVEYDRMKRRMGMVYAAENMLQEIEKHPDTRRICDSYTRGVNAYIATITQSNLPLEYKILGYRPEQWNNLKTALFIKQMTDNLAGSVDDLEMTAARSFFTDAQMALLFPELPDSLHPIIPPGTLFDTAAFKPVRPATVDSLYLGIADTVSVTPPFKPNPANGSNNWAVSGRKVRSGYPMLCNDPHLDLTLPAVWYEMQITTAETNMYGVSFPGIPGIVIGFNDSMAIGFTNAGRDVMDFYSIRFRDNSKREYWYNGQWQPAQQRIETIHVKGAPDRYDTVAYTAFGPVTYDQSFTNGLHPGRALAMRWIAHDPSNELLFYYKMARANNYEDYIAALPYFTCPAQNVVFASRSGDIALWQQGNFPNRWDRQGLYVMPGDDSSYRWQAMIPQQHNPHSYNPERAFVSSANQRPVDSAYPYFIPGGYDMYRGMRINRRLDSMSDVTAKDMQALQNDNYNSFAATARPLLLRYVNRSALDKPALKYLDSLAGWNDFNDYDAWGPTIFSGWIDSLQQAVWDDEFKKANLPGYQPVARTLIEALLRDSAFAYVDNINTPKKETIGEVITQSFLRASRDLRQLEREGRMAWGKQKNTTIYHLLRQSVMPLARTGLPIGGGKHVVNATTHNHGPSWKMIVELGPVLQAWVVYPGGQSGNPGSKYYDNFVDDWAKGKYYSAWIMRRGEERSNRIRFRMQFNASS